MNKNITDTSIEIPEETEVIDVCKSMSKAIEDLQKAIPCGDIGGDGAFASDPKAVRLCAADGGFVDQSPRVPCIPESRAAGRGGGHRGKKGRGAGKSFPAPRFAVVQTVIWLWCGFLPPLFR